jgi:hypothetical protein
MLAHPPLQISRSLRAQGGNQAGLGFSGFGKASEDDQLIVDCGLRIAD